MHPTTPTATASVITQGDFAAAVIEVGRPVVDMRLAELRAFICELQATASELEEVTPVDYWPA